MECEIVLSVQGITKTFPGTRALSDVRFELRKGEVHALVWENGAGKSTLMNIISGVLQPDCGEIVLFGRAVKLNSPKEAQDAKIGFVHQETALCPHITVAENIFMGRLKNHLGIADFAEINREAQKVLALFDTKIKPQSRIKELSVAEQQVVEIAKALSLDCRILILDEPTSALTEGEAENLFRIVEDLRDKGISILYISHRMSEIFRICDRVTIIRDGCQIDTLDVRDTTPQTVINRMVGRNIANFYPEKAQQVGEVLFEVRNLARHGVFRNISLVLYRREILGLAGLVGSKRTDVARAICGIDRRDGGEIFLEGRKLNIESYQDAIAQGLAYLTEDRKDEGLFVELAVERNITTACLSSVAKGGLIVREKERKWADDFIARLNIKVRDARQKVSSLSGGNQQKVVLARWLSINPKILILDEPTRGIDVGAKSEIHNMLRRLADEGIGVIVISSELPEIIGMCDRVAVMCEGAISGLACGEEINENRIIALASGHH